MLTNAILFVDLLKKTNLAVKDVEIANNVLAKLQDFKIASKLTFNTHVNDIRKKAGQKLHALETN